MKPSSSNKADMIRTILTGGPEHLENWNDVWSAYCSNRELPPLRLKAGITIHHERVDPVPFLFYEIFLLQAYTGGGFYKPHPSDVVIDCGANIGVFALFIAGACKEVRIHCFEPCRETRGRLEYNIRRNGLASTIYIHPFAIFDSECKLDLKNAPSTGDSSFFDRETAPVSHEIADCVSLKTALHICGEEKVDLLKIDAEGAELEIVESAGLETWRRIGKVAVEYHEAIRPGCKEKLLKHLKLNGFSELENIEGGIYNPGLGLIRARRAESMDH
jgi:FkbM family methyltransferase